MRERGIRYIGTDCRGECRGILELSSKHGSERIEYRCEETRPGFEAGHGAGLWCGQTFWAGLTDAEVPWVNSDANELRLERLEEEKSADLIPWRLVRRSKMIIGLVSK